jgi:hypothetical protein
LPMSGSLKFAYLLSAGMGISPAGPRFLVLLRPLALLTPNW